jgi:ribosomal protein S18 acetylase RimI-like enzyme
MNLRNFERKSRMAAYNSQSLLGLEIKREKNIPSIAVQDICESVGWARRDSDLISIALENSLVVISAWENGRLIAFARATGDKVFNATVWDVVVRPSHQGRGLGRLVMKEVLKALDSYDIPLITLYADQGTQHFYEKLGFLSEPSGAQGMFREKYYQTW